MLSLNEKISLAISSSDLAQLTKLASDSSSSVRRAVARNNYTPMDTLAKLIYDQVLNVSYMASLNPNCTIQREFKNDINHPCVSCTTSENRMNCTNCTTLNKFNYSN